MPERETISSQDFGADQNLFIPPAEREKDIQPNEAKDKFFDKLPESLEDLLGDMSGDKLAGFAKKFLSLPRELQEVWERRWAKEQAMPEKILADLDNIIKTREKEGHKKIMGYHVSLRNLSVGAHILPDRFGKVYYSEDINSLYGRYGGGWLYLVEGTADDEVIDESLGWRSTKGKMKIVDKVLLNEESQKKWGWKFAKCEYH